MLRPRFRFTGSAFLTIAFGLALLLLTGCPAQDDSGNTHGRPHGGPVRVQRTYSGSYPIQAVGTTAMVAELVRQVGGEHVAVTQLMGEGVDPHQYKASPGDVNQLSGADLIFYNGLHLEGKMAEVFARLAKRKPTFAVCEYLEPKDILQGEQDYYDPHLWFDVSLWTKTCRVVRDILVAYDPAHAGEYDRRHANYQEELAKLHEEARQKLATVPRERRVLITAHDAFRYFGRAYDIEVRGIQGISTESEAGVKEINTLVGFISERKIKAVFVESSVSDRNVQALVEGCKARGHTVVIGGELFSDAMGKPGTPEGSYAGMVRHNVETIVKALR